MSISPRDDGLAPVCPHTLAESSRAAGHRHSPSLLTADPCQPRLASLLPRSLAASRCPRSSPPLIALVRRPRSPPPLVAPAAHRRQCSLSQLAATRLDAQACHPSLHYPPVVPVARAGNLPPRPAGPALFSGQLLNHLQLAARRSSPPLLRLAAPAHPGPPLASAIAPFKLSAKVHGQAHQPGRLTSSLPRSPPLWAASKTLSLNTPGLPTPPPLPHGHHHPSLLPHLAPRPTLPRSRHPPSPQPAPIPCPGPADTLPPDSPLASASLVDPARHRLQQAGVSTSASCEIQAYLAICTPGVALPFIPCARAPENDVPISQASKYIFLRIIV
jgi:hypothetical protein